MPDKVVQIVPAAAGWRLVEALLGARGRLADLPDDQLFHLTPVACFALVENEDGVRLIRHVVAEDWPAYFWVSDDMPYSGRMDYLGPGEKPTEEHRKLAIELIRQSREKREAEEREDAGLEAPKA